MMKLKQKNGLKTKVRIPEALLTSCFFKSVRALVGGCKNEYDKS